MLEVQITKEMIENATTRALAIGSLNNSIRLGKGNLVGCLGEAIVLSTLDNATLANTYDYDIIVDGLKLDVKTKERTVVPKSHYECSVANFNTKQKCDHYVFVSILVEKRIPKMGYILGYISKENFYEKASFHNKGELDERNNFTFTANCYNIEIHKLNSWED